MKHSAHKDLLYTLVIWSAPLIVLLFLIFSFSVAILVIFVLSLLLSLWLWTSTSYEISEGNLFVRCWIFSKKANIKNIVKVRKTRNLLASFATALDRLEITEKNGSKYYVSPSDFQTFIAELKKHNPDIEVG